MRYLLALLLLLGCTEQITPPETGRSLDINFEVKKHDQTETVSILWEYSITQYDESQPLDPIVLFVDSKCDCDPETYSTFDVTFDELNGKGGLNFTPPDSATVAWFVSRWVDDLGEHSVESDHLEL